MSRRRDDNRSVLRSRARRRGAPQARLLSALESGLAKRAQQAAHAALARDVRALATRAEKAEAQLVLAMRFVNWFASRGDACVVRPPAPAALPRSSAHVTHSSPRRRLVVVTRSRRAALRSLPWLGCTGECGDGPLVPLHACDVVSSRAR